jgi:ankyrin repeat protein
MVEAKGPVKFVADSMGNNLIHLAAFYRNFTLLQALNQVYGSNLIKAFVPNSKGNTPLHLAVATKRAN